MTYAIIAVVLLVVVLLFALMSRKSADTDQSAQGSQSASKPAQKLADSRPKSTRPPPTPAEKAKRSEPPPGEPTSPRADERPSPAVVREEPASAAAAPAQPRDIAGLRKGLAKARGEGGFLGRLASFSRARKSSIRTIADQVEEILLTSDVGVATTKPSSVALARRAQQKRALELAGGRGTRCAPTPANPRHRRRAHRPSRKSRPWSSWWASTASARRPPSASSRPS